MSKGLCPGAQCCQNYDQCQARGYKRFKLIMYRGCIIRIMICVKGGKLGLCPGAQCCQNYDQCQARGYKRFKLNYVQGVYHQNYDLCQRG